MKNILKVAIATIAGIAVLAAISDAVSDFTTNQFIIATDLITITLSILAIWIGIKSIRQYGGKIGECLQFVLAAVVLIGVARLLDAIARQFLNLSGHQWVEETLIKNYLILASSVLILYGLWKLKE